MPFTIGGDYIPPEKNNNSPQLKKSNKPIRVRVEKRKQSFVTLIENLSLEEDALKSFLSSLKKKFSCGGTLKEGVITLQGNFEKEILEYLKTLK